MRASRRTTGYRPNRPNGCLSVVIWLGIAFNTLLILVSLGEGSPLSLSSFLPTPNATDAAQRALAAGDVHTAVTQSRVSLASNPTDTRALMTLVRALIYRSYTDFQYDDDLQAALDEAEAGLAANTNHPDALAAYAFALQANGQAVEAAEIANRVLNTLPNHTLARTALGLAYARAGSFEVARRESLSAIENDQNTPEVFEAYRAFAISTADLGNYREAGDLLDQLIAQYDSVIPLYFERALYARQVGDAEAAETAYLRVVTLDPQNVKARLRLCELATAGGEYANALQYCQQVTELAPSLPDGWYRMGRLHFLQGDFQRAQSELNRCSTLQVTQGVPPNQRIFECWYLQGQAAEILGDCPSLIATYNQFQIMAADQAVRETWTYPPEGPSMCVENPS